MCTATASVFFLYTNFHATAESVGVDSGETVNLVDKTYTSEGAGIKGAAIHVDGSTGKNGGTIIGTNITLTSNGAGGIGAGAMGSNSVIILTNTKIHSIGLALAALDGGQISMKGGSIDTIGTALNISSPGNIAQLTSITLDDVDVKADLAIYVTDRNSRAIINGGKISANTAFSIREGGQAKVTDTTVIANKVGINLVDRWSGAPTGEVSQISMTNANVTVENGTGILNQARLGKIDLKNSVIRADVLLISLAITKTRDFEKIEDRKDISPLLQLKAEDSILEGNTRILDDRKVSFDLTNTTWYLKISNEKDGNGDLIDIATRSNSQISELILNNSKVIFKEPMGSDYQTLLVGPNISSLKDSDSKDDISPVYVAQGDTQVHFNAIWSSGKNIKDQKTDRLLINGDVAGTTTVHVKIKRNGEDKDDTLPWNQRGLSLIQISGEANENSFKLANGYVALDGKPYKYILNAYGKNSSHGAADADQNLINPGNDFWDFRLQNEYLNPSPPNPGNPDPGNPDPGRPNPDGGVKAVVPQVASYLVLPNTLFSAGLTDINHQNTLLSHIWSAPQGTMRDNDNIFFFSSYGHAMTLSSKRTALEYSYGANTHYTALQAGLILKTLESQSTITHIGWLGTYGELSFTPRDMADSDKNKLDKLSFTAYSSTQYNDNLYIDTLLSYGMILNGNTTNAIIGKTSTLEGTKTFSLSSTIRKPLEIGINKLVFEPKAQLSYQYLMFDTISDVDGFKVDMGHPSQWSVRIGGRLTKTIKPNEKINAFSFYSKLDIVKIFGNDSSIKIGDIFQRDPVGDFLEGGIGVDAQLSSAVSLYGEMNYQHKFQKFGMSGKSFSGGLRYRF